MSPVSVLHRIGVLLAFRLILLHIRMLRKRQNPACRIFIRVPCAESCTLAWTPGCVDCYLSMGFGLFAGL